MNDWWDHIKHFTRKEMACPCCGKSAMQKHTMLRLDMLREQYGKPLAVTSGFRCPAHNLAVGGASGSKHMKGEAADLAVRGPDAYKIVSLAPGIGFVGLGVAKTFVHVDDSDDRPVGTLWTYR